jgi:hypothetical protein
MKTTSLLAGRPLGLLLFMLFVANNIFANKSTYQKLVEVNKCWTEQKDISTKEIEGLNALSEEGWISLHLSLVEQTLRARKTLHLNPIQQANRVHCLDILHRYWQEGNFPINEDYATRTPIFIDKHNNFCAVGFLIKETGNEAISRMIASKTNLAYVREMNYPELGLWAKENGFTVDELAWIQPAYSPKSRCEKIGKGVDGFVQELFVDTAIQQLYVGGNFYEADKSFVANNIAYVTENAGDYTWHKMGNGVNGQVNAIVKFDSKIFVAGSFDSASGIPTKNIAYWDGSIWHSAGCLDGVVNDLLVFEGNLYAAGVFKSCGSGIGENFAIWDGTKWTTIAGLSGRVNTMEATDTYIALGGKFDFDTALNVNAIKWNPISSFQKFPNKLNSEVMDFELYQDTLHASCKRAIATDTFQLLQKLNSDGWVSFFSSIPVWFYFKSSENLSFNTLCSEGSSINIGGYFSSNLGMTYVNNVISFGSYWIDVDSTVNKIVLFKTELIVAGKFKKGMAYTLTGESSSVELNGITKRSPAKLSVVNAINENQTFNIYPNPVASGKTIMLDNSFSATEYNISSIDGKQYNSGKVNNRNEIQLPQLATGIYNIRLSNSEGTTIVKKLSIE